MLKRQFKTQLPAILSKYGYTDTVEITYYTENLGRITVHNPKVTLTVRLIDSILNVERFGRFVKEAAYGDAIEFWAAHEVKQRRALV